MFCRAYELKTHADCLPAPPLPFINGSSDRGMLHDVSRELRSSFISPTLELRLRCLGCRFAYSPALRSDAPLLIARLKKSRRPYQSIDSLSKALRTCTY